MARTKSSVSVKATSVKSSKARANAAPPPSTPKTSSKRSREKKSANPYAGANPNKFWETPAWQKPITNFFKRVHADKVEEGSKPITVVNHSGEPDQESEEGSSKEVNPRRLRILDSSDEEEDELPELDGEDSHKIVEYFQTLSQSDGDASETAKDKENQSPDDANGLKATAKRDLDKDDSSPEEQPSKKIKVNGELE